MTKTPEGLSLQHSILSRSKLLREKFPDSAKKAEEARQKLVNKGAHAQMSDAAKSNLEDQRVGRFQRSVLEQLTEDDRAKFEARRVKQFDRVVLAQLSESTKSDLKERATKQKFDKAYELLKTKNPDAADRLEVERTESVKEKASKTMEQDYLQKKVYHKKINEAFRLLKINHPKEAAEIELKHLKSRNENAFSELDDTDQKNLEKDAYDGSLIDASVVLETNKPETFDLIEAESLDSRNNETLMFMQANHPEITDIFSAQSYEWTTLDSIFRRLYPNHLHLSQYYIEVRNRMRTRAYNLTAQQDPNSLRQIEEDSRKLIEETKLRDAQFSDMAIARRRSPEQLEAERIEWVQEEALNSEYIEDLDLTENEAFEELSNSGRDSILEASNKRMEDARREDEELVKSAHEYKPKSPEQLEVARLEWVQEEALRRLDPRLYIDLYDTRERPSYEGAIEYLRNNLEDFHQVGESIEAERKKWFNDKLWSWLMSNKQDNAKKFEDDRVRSRDKKAFEELDQTDQEKIKDKNQKFMLKKAFNKLKAKKSRVALSIEIKHDFAMKEEAFGKLGESDQKMLEDRTREFRDDVVLSWHKRLYYGIKKLERMEQDSLKPRNEKAFGELGKSDQERLEAESNESMMKWAFDILSTERVSHLKDKSQEWADYDAVQWLTLNNPDLVNQLKDNSQKWAENEAFHIVTRDNPELKDSLESNSLKWIRRRAFFKKNT